MWETEAACPITDTDTEGRNCSIKDRNSEYTFDLSPLRQRGDQDYYEVSGTGGDKIRVYTVITSIRIISLKYKGWKICLFNIKSFETVFCPLSVFFSVHDICMFTLDAS